MMGDRLPLADDRSEVGNNAVRLGQAEAKIARHLASQFEIERVIGLRNIEL